MIIWRLFLVFHTVAPSQFLAIRNSTSPLYTLFVRKCDDEACDCYADVDDPQVNLKLGNFTKDWYTASQVTHRDNRALEWRCSIDGDLLYRNSAVNGDQLWYDFKNKKNINLFHQKLDPCKNYIDIELALVSGQEVGESGSPIPCIFMALNDVKDPIENDDYLFISSTRNGSQSHCRHQLMSSNDSLVLKVNPGANLTIYNEKCKSWSDQISLGRKKQADDIRSPSLPSIGDRVRNNETEIPIVPDTEIGSSPGFKAAEEETSFEESNNSFRIRPGKKNWILIGPICGSVGFIFISLSIITIFCWKKQKVKRGNKRHTWNEIYFNVNNASAQSSIRSKVDVNSPL